MADRFTRTKSVAALAALFVITFCSQSAFGQKDYAIAEVQGSGNVSPHVNEDVRVTGVVTARTKTGFFIQTPDDKIDADPATSEGIFVYTKTAPGSDAALGSMVTVSGKVQEYRPRNEQETLPITEISVSPSGSYKSISKSSTLPKPIIFTIDDFKKNTLDQLERYEGMRVSVGQMSVVAATEGRVNYKTASSVSDGIFYGTIKGLPRPFRSAGYDTFEVAFLPEKEKAAFMTAHPKLPVFDGNPEHAYASNRWLRKAASLLMSQRARR